MATTVMNFSYFKLGLEAINHRNYKYFPNDSYRYNFIPQLSRELTDYSEKTLFKYSKKMTFKTFLHKLDGIRES